ncbi:hypothetical protein PGB90_000420 [Kerria lacca]
MLDEEPLVPPAHKDFQLLFDASLEKSNCYATNKECRLIEKLHIKQNSNVNDCTTVDNAVSHEIDKIEKSKTDEKSVKLVNVSEFRNLDVIDEEPSKLEDTTTQKSNITMDCADNEKYNLFIVDVQDENKYLNNSDDEYFLIALSVVQIAVVFVTTDNIGSDSQTEHVQLINTENLNETRNNEYDLLKSMLQLRLREVETETDAFRGENSHLGKLRDDYEKEYSKFCSEKVQFKRRNSTVKRRDEMNKKESRWAAAQARIRTEMKQLKDHNTTLKEERCKIENMMTTSKYRKCM